MSTAKGEKIIELRKQGLTYSEIREEFDGNVSNGTISYHASDIELTKKQKERIQKKEKEAREGFVENVVGQSRLHSEETKKKIAQSLYETNKGKGGSLGKARRVHEEKKRKNLTELNGRTRQKIIRRMRNDGVITGCFVCSWDKAICDVHHIDGKEEDDSEELDNLIYLCPNHHRLAHKGKLDCTQYPNLQDVIGDKWRDYFWYSE